MTKTKDGGPALPFTVQRWNDSLDHGVEGMSLRDYFAAQALTGILAATVRAVDAETADRLREIKARDSYRMADAMLAERERGQ